MALTPQQTTAIDTALSVDLATLPDDRIIELCLLQKAAPEVKPEFVEALNTEITRRFTAAEIAANDVMFSVIQNFANQFTSGVPFFAKKMLEMSATVNRDIWFSNNSTMFAQAIEDETLLEWLVTQPDVVTKILNNTLGLTAIAKSYKASSAILSNAETVAILKDANNVWQIVLGQSQFMDVLSLSNELLTYVINNSTAFNAAAVSSVAMTAIAASSVAMTAIAASSVAMTAVIASSTAMTAIAASSVAMTAVIASSTAFNAVAVSSVAMTAIAASSVAMTAIAASSVAMTAVIASSTAMTAIAASSVALSSIIKSTSARNALMGSNTVFQNNRVAIYNIVKASWTKQTGVSQYQAADLAMTNINAAVASPAGFVFASLGWFGNGGLSNITHPNGILAAAKGTSDKPTTLVNLDAISFNGATFKATLSTAQAYAELWIPPTT